MENYPFTTKYNNFGKITILLNSTFDIKFHICNEKVSPLVLHFHSPETRVPTKPVMLTERIIIFFWANISQHDHFQLRSIEVVLEDMHDVCFLEDVNFL